MSVFMIISSFVNSIKILVTTNYIMSHQEPCKTLQSARKSTTRPTNPNQISLDPTTVLSSRSTERPPIRLTIAIPRERSERTRERRRRRRKQTRPRPNYEIGRNAIRQLTNQMTRDNRGTIERLAALDGSSGPSSSVRPQLSLPSNKLHAMSLAPLGRLIKRFLHSHSMSLHQTPGYFKLQMASIEALREASEHFLTTYFERCSMYVAHGGRVTLMQKDMALAKRIWNMDKEANQQL